MKKIYIDLGAYDGDTIKNFYDWGNLIDDPNKFEIYAFEPNSDLWGKVKNVTDGYENVIFYPFAVWVHDGELEFAVDKTQTPMGSTAMSGKTNIWDNYPHIKIKCIDFSSWLKQFKDDYVIVKMDIEGAEFPVLEKMIEDKTITIPDVLMVEFHPNKVREYTTTYKEDLVDRIKKLGVNIKEWH